MGQFAVNVLYAIGIINLALCCLLLGKQQRVTRTYVDMIERRLSRLEDSDD